MRVAGSAGVSPAMSSRVSANSLTRLTARWRAGRPRSRRQRSHPIANGNSQLGIHANTILAKSMNKIRPLNQQTAISMICMPAAVLACALALSVGAAAHPRIVISSDYPPLDVIPGTAGYGPPEKRSDPDDVQSMIRFLLYANEFQIEALIAASGTVAGVANKQNILDTLDVYDRVDENLRAHDRRYPTARSLRALTVQGLSGAYGKPAAQILGAGKDTEASEFIIKLLDAPNPAPVWFCFWGGTQELAQALWKIRQTRTPEQIAKTVAKIRVYMITQQDGSGRWLKEEFPQLFLIDSRRAFTGISYRARGADEKLGDLAWLEENVRSGHGPLGAVYPQSGWNHTSPGVIEGDSPSFLYVLNGVLGLSDPEKPWFGGWGGRFTADGQGTSHWSDSPEGGAAVTRWTRARQNDFAARMDWCLRNARQSNHNPTAVINGDHTKNVIYAVASPGQKVDLSANNSADPDGNALTYNWWRYKEADDYQGEIILQNSASKNAHFIVPRDGRAGVVHIILEVSDNGLPSLTSYRRAVIQIGGSQ